MTSPPPPLPVSCQGSWTLSSARSQRAKEALNTVPTGRPPGAQSRGEDRGQGSGGSRRTSGQQLRSHSPGVSRGCGVWPLPEPTAWPGFFPTTGELPAEESRLGSRTSAACADSVPHAGDRTLPHPSLPQTLTLCWVCWGTGPAWQGGGQNAEPSLTSVPSQAGRHARPPEEE